MQPIYLDNNATTKIDDRVLKAMLPYLTDKFGNAASSTHSFGWIAKDAVEQSREKIAALISADSSEIIFTSGSTESINLAIKGVYDLYHRKGKHIIITASEHKAVLDTCKYLEKQGAEISMLSVNEAGLIDIEELENMIRPDTILVSVIMANNETGVIQDMKKISEVVHNKNSILMSDTTQACGKIPVNVNELGIDLLCMSAHKMYGPKGVAALFVRRKGPRVSINAQIHGGGHEKDLRSGTLNVPGIVGLGAACEIAAKEMKDDAVRISALRDKLEKEIMESGNISINGDVKQRLPNTSNLCFHNIKASGLLKKMPEIALATGSACTSAIPQPSHVLMAMGLTEENAYSSIRFSLGRFTTEKEIEIVISKFKEHIKSN
ncbi:MAG: cysteine desulfurase [Bacteroidetes bacterium]|nr:MAG: cysteine desulfurase [Bacteroidota bacterium]REK03458.1 MAG: cysteine desulfurase [Bacteroidota bacterium]REK34763.1 MAG: cysteine desulfurase [Bacteroidota bacterium]REK51359.1 MAG: cysteine desulfurase [Bacteroidota bacterium]